MLSSGTASAKAVALCAIAIFSQFPFSLAGVARSHGQHYHQSPKMIAAHVRRAPSGSTEIPTGELQMLRSEYTTFHGWIEAWLETAPKEDPATSVAQLKQEFQAHDGYMNAWLDAALDSGNPSKDPPPPPPSSVPLPKPTGPPPVTAGPPPSHTPPAGKPGPSSDPGKSAPSSPAHVPPPLPPPPTSSDDTTPTAPATSAPSTPSKSSAPKPPPGGGGGSGGGFDPKSSSNLAVYYGQTPATASVPLSNLCSNPDVNIVLLAFLTTYFGPGGYPSVNFGSACNGGPSEAQTAKGASGLLHCPDLAKDIQACQASGKKVLLSLGGALATTAFESDGQAQGFAGQLWDLFGGGKGEDGDVRPLGDVVIDGFDIDNEDHSTAHYTAFVSALREKMPAGGNHYISAAPQCPRPDASIPLDAMKQMDFVFVQFYNNGECDVGQSGFLDSLKAWSDDLGSGPRLYVGAPACPSCAGRGYVEPGAMSGVIGGALKAGLGNFGGVMLWDGSEGTQNGDYFGVVKGALGG